MKNKLIVFEGIDGVGKSTLSKMLKNKLNKIGIPAVKYEDFEDRRQEYNLIKSFIKKEAPINSSLFFYLSSAIYKSKKIENLLKKHWVICDRYIYSTIAYHKIRGADMSLISKLSKFPIIFPDFLFLIKTKESIRIKRIKTRRENDALDFKKKKSGGLVSNMEVELEKFKPIIVDNSKSAHTSIQSILSKLFKKND